AKKPEERYATPRDLLQELRGLQVEGLEEGWAEALGDWSTPEMIALSDGRLEATQQLDALMKTTGVLMPAPGKRWTTWLAVLMSLVLGVVLAFSLRGTSPLAGANAQGVPQRENAWAQLYHAKLVDTE